MTHARPPIGDTFSTVWQRVFAEQRLIRWGSIEGFRGAANQSEQSETSREQRQKQPEKRAAESKRPKRWRGAESEDKKRNEEHLAALERRMESADDPLAAQKERAQSWLNELAGELIPDGATLELGEPKAVARAAVEQYGVYVNGQHAGDITAGFEEGSSVRDPRKYERSPGGATTFTKSGFEWQVGGLSLDIAALTE